MKKFNNFFYFILIPLLFISTNVNAYTENSADGSCSSNNEFFDPYKITVNNTSTIVDNYYNYRDKFGTSKAKMAHALVYDITYATIYDHYLYLYGFAFDRVIDNDLGGGLNGDKAGATWLQDDDTRVQISLTPQDNLADDDPRRIWIYDIVYADPSDASCSIRGCGNDDYDGTKEPGRPKFYDYTYWNCYRKNNQCMSDDTTFLYGGFRAKIDLNLLKDKEEDYHIQLRWRHETDWVANQAISKWTNIAIAKNNADPSIEKYNSKFNNMHIGGLSEETEIILDEGRLMGTSGFHCTSGVSDDRKITAVSKYKKGAKYLLNMNTKLISACRGGTNTVDNTSAKINKNKVEGFYSACSSSGNGAGSVLLYPLRVNCKTKSGYNYLYTYDTTCSGGKKLTSELTVYAPIIWLKHKGEVKISVAKEEKKEISCIDADHPTQYNFNYLFLLPVTDEQHGTVKTTAKGKEFNDSLLFKKLGININTSNVKSGVIPITSDTVEDFYKNLKLAHQNGKMYPPLADASSSIYDYYLTHSRWCNGENCTDTTDLSDIDVDDYVNASTKADKTIIEKINTVDNSSGTTSGSFNFSISRKLSAHLNGRSQIANPLQKTVKIKDDQVSYSYIPNIYRVAVCPGTVTTCEDSVLPSVCEGEEGTKAIFHESDDLKACTLNRNQNSGFSIIEKGEGITENRYCEVACKDDFDIDLPTKKHAKAGTYYELDSYIPAVHVKRVCVSSVVKYTDFRNELAAKEHEVVEAYNNYKGWENVINLIKSDSNVETQNGEIIGFKDNTDDGSHDYTVCSESPPCVEDCCTTIEDGCDYTDHSKTIPGVDATKAVNGITYSGTTITWRTHGYLGHTDGTDTSMSTYKTDVKDNYDKWKDLYETRLEQYNDMVKDYQDCFDWKDNYTLSYGDGTPTSPKLKFSYKDDYSDVLFSSKNLEPRYWNEAEPVNTTLVFGIQNKDTDNYFSDPTTIGNEEITSPTDLPYINSPSTDTRHYKKLDCQGNTCDFNSSRGIEFKFHKNSFVKRTEYTDIFYDLPRLYTEIPSGKVKTLLEEDSSLSDSNTVGNNKTLLVKQAVPVSITEKSGVYDYKIVFSDLMDEIRKDADKKNPNPNNLQDRFEKSYALNDGDTYTCDYEVTEDIIVNKEPNFFYRTIDPNDMNPQGRTLGYNWTNKRGTKVQELIKNNDTDYQKLTSQDKFTFTLTPTTMQQIREYNRKQSSGYSDWNLSCSPIVKDGSEVKDKSGALYYCTSELLDCLTGYCSNTSFKGVYTSPNYSKSELDANRAKLKNKLIDSYEASEKETPVEESGGVT